jgi:L-cysteine:1D-myo-inositol 2-amino-2-deoxy-alpha-D-glucopyranoside ligase
VVALNPGPVAGLYVCGITPYDATHMGHAATYVTFDVLGRALRDAGYEVRYVQNVTDVDDPLLARAVRDGVDWVHLADRETALFREDMTALSVSSHLTTTSVSPRASTSSSLMSRRCWPTGWPIRVDTPDAVGGGVGGMFISTSRQRPGFGDLSGLTRERRCCTIFAERGGDPDREGKRDPLDPLLWRAERADEPSWDGASRSGRGRPGWHIECTALAVRHLGMPFTVQGGGTDLDLPPPRDERCPRAAHSPGRGRSQRSIVHQAMVAFEGEKMSKSKGNLVLVSARCGRPVSTPMVISLASVGSPLPHRVGVDRRRPAPGDQQRLAGWRTALSGNGGAPAAGLLAKHPGAGRRRSGHSGCAGSWSTRGPSRTLEHGGSDLRAPGLVARAIDRILGIRV